MVQESASFFESIQTKMEKLHKLKLNQTKENGKKIRAHNKE